MCFSSAFQFSILSEVYYLNFLRQIHTQLKLRFPIPHEWNSCIVPTEHAIFVCFVKLQNWGFQLALFTWSQSSGAKTADIPCKQEFLMQTHTNLWMHSRKSLCWRTEEPCVHNDAVNKKTLEQLTNLESYDCSIHMIRSACAWNRCCKAETRIPALTSTSQIPWIGFRWKWCMHTLEPNETYSKRSSPYEQCKLWSVGISARSKLHCFRNQKLACVKWSERNLACWLGCVHTSDPISFATVRIQQATSLNSLDSLV